MSPEPDLPDGSKLAEDLASLFASGGSLLSEAENKRLLMQKRDLMSSFIRRVYPSKPKGPIRQESMVLKMEFNTWKGLRDNPIKDSISLSDLVEFITNLSLGAQRKLASFPLGSSERVAWERNADYWCVTQEVVQAASELQS